MEKIAIVTGANSGMGKATTLALMNLGYHVVMACRDLKRGEEALIEVTKEAAAGQSTLITCDLASFTSIETFTGQFRARFERLDVLIANAGVILTSREETEQGFEKQLGVNHFGHAYLIHLLTDLLKTSAPSRIVIVASGAHKVGRIDYTNLPMKRHYGTFRAYSRSKLANVIYAKELSRRFQGSGVTVNSCHPGAVGTSMGVNRQTGFGQGLMSLLSHVFLTPKQGADTAIFLATSKTVENMNGYYFYKRQPTKTSKNGSDPLQGRRLWEATQREIHRYQENKS